MTDVRRLWPEVLEEVKGRRRFTWILLSQNAQVADVRDGVLVLAMAGIGPRDSFAKGGSENILREALNDALGVDLRIETIVDPSVPAGGRGAGSSGPGPSGSGSSGPAGGQRGGSAPGDVGAAPPTAGPGENLGSSGVSAQRVPAVGGPNAGGPNVGAPNAGAPYASGPAPGAPPSPPVDNSASRSDVGGAVREQARQSIRPTRQGGAGASGEVEDLRDEAVSVHDSNIEELEESQTELLARQLGAEIIGEEQHGV